ncbi:nuclear transport factor 2 family protein [Algoriphagus formosus]|uniref:nuclear transport factor 2 family protein n=1 Tax=Algoriphagus formosus TaxID=2007308 RepID=UPI003F6ECF85
MRFLLFFWILPLFGLAQESDNSMILAQREKSNTALRAFDETLNATFLTDDVLITTGAGTLISGKKELLEYIQEASGPRMYWVRTPDEVIVNPETQLAWETGTWKGFVEGSEESEVGGKYSAQWTKKSGTWLIQSQLFVTLP